MGLRCKAHPDPASVLSDLRLAFRSLARTPAFAAVIVITLALGIGANTAIFEFFPFDPVPRDLPYAAAERRLVMFKQSATDYGEPMGSGHRPAGGGSPRSADKLRQTAGGDLAAYTLTRPR